MLRESRKYSSLLTVLHLEYNKETKNIYKHTTMAYFIMEKVATHQMYDNKKIVTYIMVHPYVEIPCNHLNYVFEEEYIILENAYNFKKKENTHCK